MLNDQNGTAQRFTDTPDERPKRLGLACWATPAVGSSSNSRRGPAATCTIRSQMRFIPVESSTVRLCSHDSSPKRSHDLRAFRRLSFSAARTQTEPRPWLAKGASWCGALGRSGPS